MFTMKATYHNPLKQPPNHERTYTPNSHQVPYVLTYYATGYGELAPTLTCSPFFFCFKVSKASWWPY